jgi:hypothetical protein
MLEDRQQCPTVVRTSRGLSVAGTRITLYSIMDCVVAGWPPKLIRDRFAALPPKPEQAAIRAKLAAAKAKRQHP